MEHREAVNKLIAKREHITGEVVKRARETSELKQALVHHDEARKLFQIAAQATQKKLEYSMSEIVTLALAAIDDDPYKFKVEFTPRRNSTECDLMFERQENKVNPLAASGYGAVDIASLALRVSYWAAGNSRNTLIWDEPCRNLAGALHEQASQMIKMLTSKLKLQQIMVTHSETLPEFADAVFEVVKNNGVSKVVAR